MSREAPRSAAKGREGPRSARREKEVANGGDVWYHTKSILRSGGDAAAALLTGKSRWKGEIMKIKPQLLRRMALGLEVPESVQFTPETANETLDI